jgi:ATP-binding protein involved in chromosome partitioning
MVESGAVTNVVTFGDEVVDLVLHTQRCTSRNVRKKTLKKQSDLVSPEAS